MRNNLKIGIMIIINKYIKLQEVYPNERQKKLVVRAETGKCEHRT